VNVDDTRWVTAVATTSVNAANAFELFDFFTFLPGTIDLLYSG
jgi:hypothetical protein